MRASPDATPDFADHAVALAAASGDSARLASALDALNRSSRLGITSRASRLAAAHARSDGYSLLSCAILSPSPDSEAALCVELLVFHGASPHANQAHLDTPMHLAARLNRPACLRELSSHGADANAQNSLGDRPIHLAAIACSLDALICLADAGADMLALDAQGRSIVDLAKISHLGMPAPHSPASRSQQSCIALACDLFERARISKRSPASAPAPSNSLSH